MSKADKLGAVSRSDVYHFDPDDLILVTDKTSSLYDPRVSMPLDRNLVDSIKVLGILLPILVRKNGERPDGRYVVEVVEGRQRVRAARVANAELQKEGKPRIMVPGRIRVDDNNGMMMTMYAANEQRVNDDPVTKADKVKHCLHFGMSEDDVRTTFRLSRAGLNDMLALAGTASPVREAVASGQLSVAAAVDLSTLSLDAQVAEIRKMAMEGLFKKPRKVAAAAREAKGGRGRVNKLAVHRSRRGDVVAAMVYEVDKACSGTASGTIVLHALRWVLGADDTELRRLLKLPPAK